MLVSICHRFERYLQFHPWLRSLIPRIPCSGHQSTWMVFWAWGVGWKIGCHAESTRHLICKTNHERISLMLCGVGRSRMTRLYLSHGLRWSMLMLNPANSASFLQNWDYSGFSIIPFYPQTSNQFAAWKKQSSTFSAQNRVPSIHFVLLGMSATISSYLLDVRQPWRQSAVQPSCRNPSAAEKNCQSFVDVAGSIVGFFIVITVNNAFGPHDDGSPVSSG